MSSRLSRAVLLTLVACRSSPAADAQPKDPTLTWTRPVEVATGGGMRGPWQQNDSKFDYVDDASVTLTPRGDAVVVWVDHRPKDVLLQVYDSANRPRLPKPVNVSRTPDEFSWLPRVVVSPTQPNDIYVLWQEIVFSGGPHGGEMYFARSLDGGATFEAPQNLTHSIAGEGKGRVTEPSWDNGSFDLAIDSHGTLYAVWTDWEGTLSFTRSTDRGEHFTKPAVVAQPTPKPARGPSLAVGADSRLYLAWTVGEDTSADIRFTVSGDGGTTFEPPRIVEKTPGYSDAPAVSVDRRGTVHLVYADHTGNTTTPADIRYLRSTDSGRTFGRGVVLSRPQPDSSKGASFPSTALDDKDHLFVVWDLYPDPAERPAGLGITYSLDGGTTFSRPALVPYSRDTAGGTNGSHQGLFLRKLAATGDGSIAVTNSSLLQNVRSHAWFVRGQTH